MGIKIVIISFAVLFFILTALFFFIGNYFYEFAINLKKKKIMEAPGGTPQIIEPDDEKTRTRHAADEAFRQSVPRRDVYVQSCDGLRLHALQWDINENDNKTHHNWAVVVHGYTSKAEDMTGAVRSFHGHGFHVLAPDLRGHGQSEGRYAGMGWPDRLDIIRWIDYILLQNADAQIVLYGVSMGAATVMMTAGEALPAAVKAVIEDCGYTSAVDEFTLQLKNMFKLPAFPILHAAGAVTRLRAGYRLRDASAIKQLAKCTVPVMFIHGGKDTFVPFSMLDVLYDACPTPKEKLVIENAGHFRSSHEEPERYWTAVFDFLARYI